MKWVIVAIVFIVGVVARPDGGLSTLVWALGMIILGCFAVRGADAGREQARAEEHRP